MRRIALALAGLLPAFLLKAADSRLTGSIDFNEPALWGQAIRYGLTDAGLDDVSKTYWYVENNEEGDSKILQHEGTATGYLSVDTEGAVHRTTSVTDETGPGAETGLTLTSAVYLDAKIRFDESRKDTYHLDEKDKIVFWFYKETDDETSTNRLLVAKSDTESYATSVSNVDLTVEHRVTLKAAVVDDVTGFYLYFDGNTNAIRRADGGGTFFPSHVQDNYLNSMGFQGRGLAESIAFTRTNPLEDEEYDKPDLSMLREAAEFTVDGYEHLGAALAGFPVLVRISETDSGLKSAIAKFRYRQTESGGAALRFTDENGQLLPYEVDTWNEDDESLVWVRVPYFRRNATIRMHWNQSPGTALPANDPTSVWKGYLGVWHFNESIADGTAARTAVSEDATGNGYHAEPVGGASKDLTQMVSCTGAIGLGRENDARLGERTAGNALTLQRSSALALGENFTISGWFNVHSCAGSKTADQARLFSRKISTEEGEGFRVTLNGDPWTHLQLFGASKTGTALAASSTAFPDAGWMHVTAVYEGKSVTLYTRSAAGGVQTSTGTLAAAATDCAREITFGADGDFLGHTLVGAFDECRLRTGAVSADWVKAEYGQSTDAGYLKNGGAVTKGTYNFWVDNPSVTPVAWTPETAESVVFDNGTPFHGSVIVRYYDMDGNELETLPKTTPGTYRIAYLATDGVRDAITYEIVVSVSTPQPYSQIDGYDRILLFNSDYASDAAVALQGFDDVDSQTNRVWHKGDSVRWPTRLKRRFPYVKDGTEFTYMEPETQRELWTLRHVRIGNLFTGDGDGEVEDGMQLLPWGTSTARRFDDSDKLATAPRHAGTLIFQNISTVTYPDDPATIVSPVYTNGIGTIYFDAVNAYADYSNALKIEVSVNGEDWRTVSGIDVFAVRDGVCDESHSLTNQSEIALDLAGAGGTTNWFFRIRAAVNVRAAEAQFRIVRTDEDWGALDDAEGAIVLDNLIVSTPVTTVKLSQFGAPADSNDTRFRGQKAPFDIAFPSANDLGRLHGAVRVTAADAQGGPVDPSAISALRMSYRWRYLNQIGSPSLESWKELLMRADPENPERYLTTEPLEGLGIGDFEYRFSATLNVPFYKYHDYSGLSGWTWPGEESGQLATLSLKASDEGLYVDELSPAYGRDFFVRIRDGASSHEALALEVRENDSTVSRDYPMTLWSDYTWRAFYPTTNAATTRLSYRIKFLNRQERGATDYSYSTNYYTTTAHTEFPVSDSLQAATASDWTSCACDTATGHLMFQVRDDELGLSIVHADYQNFNAWTDARASGLFIASTNDVAGVSPGVKTQEEDFSRYYPSIATNNLWENSFDEKASTEGDYAVYKQRIGQINPVPKGWTAANGMWVPQAYNELGGTSIALQMMPKFGSLQMGGITRPRGIDTVAFRARIAQAYDFTRINTYLGTGSTNVIYSTNYTFAVKAAMRTPSDLEFAGVGSLSAFAYYRADTGAYEARIERIGTNSLQLSIYKWSVSGSAASATQVATKGPFADFTVSGQKATPSKGFVLNYGDQKYLGGLVVSVENQLDGSTKIVAGVLKTASANTPAESLENGKAYEYVTYTDSSANFTSGSFGLASICCPAVFVQPTYVPVPVTIGASDRLTAKGGFSLLEVEKDLAAWYKFADRLPPKDTAKDFPKELVGFRAIPPSQELVVSSCIGSGAIDYACTNIVSSFEFTLFTNYVRRTGKSRDCIFTLPCLTNATEVVIDDIAVTQWAGTSYDDEDDENNKHGIFTEVSSGSPNDFVYTTAWVDDGNRLEITPMRAATNTPVSLRTPLMDGGKNRGIGLGMFSVAYRDADRHARLLIQIATNNVVKGDLKSLTKSLKSSEWTTVETIDFSKMTSEVRKSGVISVYIGVHGLSSVARIISDPAVGAAAVNPLDNPYHDPAYGRVYLVSALVKDNPALNARSWWGWNLKTTDGLHMYLNDYAGDRVGSGLSFALNNSIKDEIRESDADQYPIHKPFLQSPVFTNEAGKCLGEISFKARKYSASDPTPTVTIYGTTCNTAATKDDAEFTKLAEIPITSTRYANYSYQAGMTSRYTGFRLAVTGVEGVKGDRTGGDGAGPRPEEGNVERVLLDEVTVTELIKARLAFRHTGAFRHGLENTATVPNVPSKGEQPLCGEAWGVQTELVPILLSEKIEKTGDRAPRVYLHYLICKGGATGLKNYPWGYTNWCTHAEAHSAELTRVTDTSNLVYRSSYITSPKAVVEPVSEPGTVVQYALTTTYYMKGQDLPLTEILTVTDWVKPAWYDPVDYNASHASIDFAAYNILDTVAPGWAWINEAQLFGTYDNNYQNTQKDYQYVEIAVPSEVDISGWQVRMLMLQDSTSSVVTNTIATFGQDGLSGTKDLAYQASGMVFRVLGSYKSYTSKTLKKSDGTLDATWVFENTDSTFFGYAPNYILGELMPVGVQLVRKSGIVEHEVVAMGTNFWADSQSPEMRAAYDPTNITAKLNAKLRNAHFFYAGSDNYRTANSTNFSLSVCTGSGTTTNEWDQRMICTPGRINTYEDGTPQVINPDHPTPIGASLVLRANLSGSHILQRIGDTGDFTNVDQLVILQKGLVLGTNIWYKIDPWYELGSVMTNGAASGFTTNGTHVYEARVARYGSNDITVVASAAIEKRLRDWGLTDKNRYTPAVMKWLETGRDAFGNDWADKGEDGNAYLAKFLPYRRGLDSAVPMTITEMYWLDMCPTIAEQYFIAGFAKPAGPREWLPDYEGDPTLTNVQMSVYMAISNGVENTQVTPYVLRGIDPGSTSWDYATGDYNWTGVTFKVTGILANGKTKESNTNNWVALRWFVFETNSFYQATDPDPARAAKAFTTELEVVDPFSKESPGYTAGWSAWVKKYGWQPPVFFGWSIDERRQLFDVELQLENNYYETE